MATSTIPMLTQAQSLLGSEQMEAVQAGTSVRVTTAQIAALGQDLVPVGPTGVASDTPSGTQNDYTVAGQMGSSIGFVELTPTTNVILTGLQAGFDGQVVTITNLTGTYTVTLNTLNNGSQAANQFRLPSNLVLAQYVGQTFQYSANIGLWVAWSTAA